MEAVILGSGAIAALVTALASAAAKALKDFSRGRLEQLCQRHGRMDRFGAILQHRRRAAMAAEAARVLAALGVIGGAVAWWVAASSAAGPAWLAALASASAVLVVVEVGVGQAVADLWSEGFLFWTWPAWDGLRRVLTPLLAVLDGLSRLLHRLARRPVPGAARSSMDEEIRAVVNEAVREGLMKDDAREMIERVIEVRQADVSEIMTPRTEMVGIPVTATLDEARRLIMETAHSRVPVYRESRDDIVGMLYVRDLLTVLGAENGHGASVQQLMRKPFFVPETKSVPSLLQEFQRRHLQIAVVLDEYGGVSGLVTIEDVLEEIVGEIADEYDEAPPETIRTVGDNVVEVDARLHIDELNERLGLSLPEDGDFDTVGGFVFSHLGRLPQVGDQFEYGNVRFTMLQVGKRKIDRLRLEIVRPSDEKVMSDES